jgi:hypothetical protein
VLVVVQFPFFDGRGFTEGGFGRLTRPSWPPETGIPRQFLRRFGQASTRKKGADQAWSDESAFMGASRAIGFPDLASVDLGPSAGGFRPAGAFRRLLCDPTRTIVRLEIGLSHQGERGPSGRLPFPTALNETMSGNLVEGLLALPTIVPRQRDGPRRPLQRQGLDLARLYATSTTRWKVPPSGEPMDYLEVGQPVVVVQFRQDDRWTMPTWMTAVKPGSIGGARLGFGRVGAGNVGTWFLGPGVDDDHELLIRSLRVCLLRLHARQEALDGLIRQMEVRRVVYEPYTPAGEALSRYIQAALKEINKKVSNREFSQSALLEAMDAASAVSIPGKEVMRVAQLDAARGQIKEATNAYLRRREADREVKIFKDGAVGEINIKGNNVLTGVNFMIAKRIQDVRVNMNNSNAKEEVKAAVNDLSTEAEELVKALPDEQSKAEVAAAVETIAAEAQKDNPTEFLVKAAGNALITAGQKVQEFSEPISKAVNTVLGILKIAL